MSRHFLPSRATARRRDRHGRGPRGPVVPPNLPAWRTRADRFDMFVSAELARYRARWGEDMARFDFAVLDVPEYDPAPWEDGVPLARFHPFERPARILGRVVFYRMPILQAAARSGDAALFIHSVVTEQVATALGQDPGDFDYLR